MNKSFGKPVIDYNIKLKKGDNVQVITGRDKGKTGTIQLVNRKKGKIQVQGINMVTKHRRASQQRQVGEKVEIPALIQVSNVMILCPDCKKGVRIKLERQENKKIRSCHRCGHKFDKV